LVCWAFGVEGDIHALLVGCPLIQRVTPKLLSAEAGFAGVFVPIKEKETAFFSIYDAATIAYCTDTHSAPACPFKGLKRGEKMVDHCVFFLGFLFEHQYCQ
jgi:hypothetical protein